jgi:heptosyltransferase-3
MNVLFITSSRIGDAVLSTGLLDHIARKYPAAKVTVVCGPLTAPLFEGYPNLARLYPLKKQRLNRHWFDLWRQVAGTRWDTVVDLRNSAISRVVPAKQRFIFGPRIDQKFHKVEQCASVMNLGYVPVPQLWFTDAQRQKARVLVPDGGPVLAVGPTANWPAKTWPAENFVQIIKFMTEDIMPGARVAVFAAKGEEEGAYKVLKSVPPDKQIDVIAKADPGTAAAAIARCAFYIGNDSGLMHCAAASGVKTLGLFGPSWPHLYRPWGGDYVSTPENFDQLIDYKGYSPKTAPCLMTSLTVEAVKNKLKNV